jgi:hypothetical protein
VRLADLLGNLNVGLVGPFFEPPLCGSLEDAVPEVASGEDVDSSGKLLDAVFTAFGFLDPLREGVPYQPRSFLLISSISLMRVSQLFR